jgi:hypothetical protein
MKREIERKREKKSKNVSSKSKYMKEFNMINNLNRFSFIFANKFFFRCFGFQNRSTNWHDFFFDFFLNLMGQENVC